MPDVEVRNDRPLNDRVSEVRNDRERTPVVSEVRQDRALNAPGAEIRDRYSLPAFVSRLTSVGATLDEVQAVRDHWDDPADPADPYTKEELCRLGDQELYDLILAGRQEFDQGTMTEDEEASARHRAAVLALAAEAENIVRNSRVPDVLEWVGDDVARAEAAWMAEQTIPDHEARKTLVEQLAKMAPAAS